jgi:hypothetical protein
MQPLKENEMNTWKFKMVKEIIELRNETLNVGNLNEEMNLKTFFTISVWSKMID